MSKYTYNGANRSMRVAGIAFAKGVEVELDADQEKALKADKFGKAFIDDGSITEVKDTKAGAKKDAKD